MPQITSPEGSEMQNETDIQYGVEYPDPIQPGNADGLVVTRQRGLDRTQQARAGDRTPPADVIQPGVPDMIVTRQAGSGAQRFDASGVLLADSVADNGQILYLDHSVHAIGEANPPPGLARTNAAVAPPSGFGEMPAAAGAPPSVPPGDRDAIKAAAIAAGFTVTDAPVETKTSPTAFDVIASDEGSADPRDMSTGPMIFSADALPVIKKAPVVPLVLPTPETRRVKAKAAPKGKR